MKDQYLWRICTHSRKRSTNGQVGMHNISSMLAFEEQPQTESLVLCNNSATNNISEKQQTDVNARLQAVHLKVWCSTHPNNASILLLSH
jgi:hypothetical protein